MTKLLVALAVLGLQFYALWFLRTEPVIPERTSFTEFPRELDGWRCREPQKLPQDIMDSLKATDYFICDYVHEASPAASPVADHGTPGSEAKLVELYIGYHAEQSRRGSKGTAAIHPPEHCLPGSGWDIVDSRIVPVVVGDRRGEAKRFLIAKGNQRQLVYFWYQSRGRVIASNYDKIFYTFLDRMLRGRTDGALVRLTVPLHNDVEAADRAVADFTKRIGPELPAYVPD